MGNKNIYLFTYPHVSGGSLMITKNSLIWNARQFASSKKLVGRHGWGTQFISHEVLLIYLIGSWQCILWLNSFYPFIIWTDDKNYYHFLKLHFLLMLGTLPYWNILIFVAVASTLIMYFINKLTIKLFLCFIIWWAAFP